MTDQKTEFPDVTAALEELDRLQKEALAAGKNESERLRDKHPGMAELYEQIQVIRKLLNKKATVTPSKYTEPWMRAYAEVVEASRDDMDPALKEAWDQYYMMKNLYKLGNK